MKRTNINSLTPYLLSLASTLIVASAPYKSTAGVPVPGRCATPVAERTSEIGCYVDANENMGELPTTRMFWHIYEFPTLSAAESAKPPHGTVVKSFGQVRMYAIAPFEWRPKAGKRVAVIGPLNVLAGKQYTARYMEAAFTPGMAALAHEHSGPEAFFVISGIQCLETSDGITVSRAGESAVAPQGSLMSVSGVGQQIRRALVVVLHDSAQPWQTFSTDWKPKGLCPP